MLPRELEHRLVQLRIANDRRPRVARLHTTQRMGEDDERLYPAQGRGGQLGMALAQKIADGARAGVDLPADALAPISVDGPVVAPAANAARELLGLDDYHAARADQHVVDVAVRQSERQVVDEPVVVGKTAEQIGDHPLSPAAGTHAPQASGNGPAEPERGRDGREPSAQVKQGRMEESGAGVADDERDPRAREHDQAGERGPQPLLAALQVMAPDAHLPHVSSAGSRPGATRFRSAARRTLSAAWDARELPRALPRPRGWPRWRRAAPCPPSRARRRWRGGLPRRRRSRR